MTRIALCSDQHFDLNSRWEECLRITGWIANDIAARQVDVIALGGDLFERRPVPIETTAAADWCIRLGNIAPLVGVYGNHEPPEALAVMERLESLHPIRFHDRAAVQIAAGVAFACVPWPRKSHLLAHLPNAGLEATEQVAQEALRNVLRGLGSELAEHEGPRVLLSHAMVRGSRTTAGQPLMGCDLEIGLDDLMLAKAHAYLLGHVHCEQDWMIGDAPVIYPGAPRRTAFGETEPKGYVILEFDGPRLVSWERIRTPATEMLLLDAVYVDGQLQISDEQKELIDESMGAEIRLRYETTAAEREGAKAAADRMVDWLKEQRGAVAVKAEPEVRVEAIARTAEIATAQTLAEKLELRWTLRAYNPADRREAMLAKLASLEEQQQQTAPRRASGGVRLEAVRVRNMGVIRDFSLDLTALGTSKLIAITGANGAGKSTLLELALPGAMHRDTPTRGSLSDLARAADSLLEATIVNGHRLTLRHLVNATNRKGESVALDENGVDLVAAKTGKRREFSKWAAENLPTPEELLTTTFCAQADHGFIGLKPGPRKAVLLRVLGIERYEQLAKTARTRVGEVKAACATLSARLEDERTRARNAAAKAGLIDCDVAAFEKAAVATREQAANAEQALTGARDALASTDARIVEAERRLTEWRATETQRAQLQQRRTTLQTQRDSLVTRIENNRAVQRESVAIRAAVAERDRLTQAIAAVDAQLQEHRRGLTEQDATLAGLDESLRGVGDRGARLEGRIRDRSAAAKPHRPIDELETERTIAAAALAGAEERLEELRGQHLVGANDRITGLRIGLEAVRQQDALDAAYDVATDTLQQDDTAVRLAAEVPAAIETARAAVARAKTALAVCDQQLTAARAATAAAEEVQALRADYAAAVSEEQDLQRRRTEVVERRTQAAAAETTLTTQRDAFTEQLDGHRALAAKAEPLANAEARLAELEPQLATADTDLAALDAQISPPTPQPDAAPDRTGPARAVSEAESAARTAAAALTLAEQRVLEARESAMRIETLEAEQRTQGIELADWNRLADDLGRDGLQADEIAAAGPGITAAANDLLHTCHGPRWTVEIKTTRDSADGKEELEGCEVQVTDTVAGRVGEAATFSGGEKVMIGEAVSLAITMLGCRRSGVEGPTLVRDESGAALDPENARAYVAMMRRAADLIGADRVLFVSHSADVVELADARVEMKTVAPTVALEAQAGA